MNQTTGFQAAGSIGVTAQEHALGSVYSEVEEIERIDRRLGEALSRLSNMLAPLMIPAAPQPAPSAGKSIGPADPMRSEIAGRIAHVRQAIDSKIDALHATLDQVHLS